MSLKEKLNSKPFINKIKSGAVAATSAVLLLPTPAHAASFDSSSVTKLLGTGITALGGILCVFGLVNLGLTIKDGMQGGGGQLGGAIAMIIGGGIIIAAGAMFGNISLNF